MSNATANPSTRAMRTYSALEAMSLPMIDPDSFVSDLTTHDRDSILANPGVPFLHWTREYGTHMIFLRPSDSPDWPAAGKLAPYIFGNSSREHILNDQANCALSMYSRSASTTLGAVYYNGDTLRTVTQDEQSDIIHDWRKALRNEWGPSTAHDNPWR